MAAFAKGHVVRFLEENAVPYDEQHVQNLMYVALAADGIHFEHRPVHLPRPLFPTLAKKMFKDSEEETPFHVNEVFRRDDDLHLALDIDLKDTSASADGAQIPNELFLRWDHHDDKSLRDFVKLIGGILHQSYSAECRRSRAHGFDVVVWKACREHKISYHMHYVSTRGSKPELVALIKRLKEMLEAQPATKDFAATIDAAPMATGNLRLPLTFNKNKSLFPRDGSKLTYVGIFDETGYLVNPTATHFSQRLYCDQRSPTGGGQRVMPLVLAMCMQNAYAPADFKTMELSDSKHCRGGWSPWLNADSNVVVPPQLANSSFHLRSQFRAPVGPDRIVISLHDAETADSVYEVIRSIDERLKTHGPEIAIAYACGLVGIMNSMNSVVYKLRDSKTGAPRLHFEPILNSHKAQWPKVRVPDLNNPKKMVYVSLLELFIQNSPGYDGKTFVPSRLADAYKPLIDGKINVWTGFNCFTFPYADIGVSLKAYNFMRDPHSPLSTILFHIWDVNCRNDDQLFISAISWMAHVIQRPDEKTMRCIVLHGREGSGKTAVWEKLFAKYLLGRHQLITDTTEPVVGTFNQAIEGACLIILSECVFKGDKALIERLKHLITGDQIPINEKQRNLRQMPNYANLVIITNQENPISGDDLRRYIFCHTSDKWTFVPKGMSESEFNQRKRKYFDRLTEATESDEGVRQFAFFLGTVDIDEWARSRHTAVWATRSLGNVRRASLSEEALLALDMIRQHANISLKSREDWGRVLPDAMNHVYLNDPLVKTWALNPPIAVFDDQWMTRIGNRHVRMLHFVTYLNKLGVTVDNDARVYRFPSHLDFSNAFDSLHPFVNGREMFSQSMNAMDSEGPMDSNLPSDSGDFPILVDNFHYSFEQDPGWDETAARDVAGTPNRNLEPSATPKRDRDDATFRGVNTRLERERAIRAAAAAAAKEDQEREKDRAAYQGNSDGEEYSDGSGDDCEVDMSALIGGY